MVTRSFQACIAFAGDQVWSLEHRTNVTCYSSFQVAGALPASVKSGTPRSKQAKIHRLTKIIKKILREHFAD